MEKELDKEDLEFILGSLHYTRLKFEDYTQYPDLHFKLKRIEEVASPRTHQQLPNINL